VRALVHEIRNHLAVAIASVEAFRDGVLEPSPARLTAVLQALGEVEVLLREIPRGPVNESLRFEPRAIDVCDIITNEVLALEALAAERGITYVVQRCAERAPGCARFVGDPVRIAEIVNNVVSNAIRYTPPGGRIEIDCRRVDAGLALRVGDDGPGIRNEEIRRIFESGFRGSASAQSEGTGVGLALVKRFVEEHGGTIEVEPATGGGAQFTVRLPGRQADPGGEGTISLF
jgi:two-component system, OmpR family, sensor histidine kinase BaeS